MITTYKLFCICVFLIPSWRIWRIMCKLRETSRISLSTWIESVPIERNYLEYRKMRNMGQYIGPQCSCWPLHKIRDNTLVRVTATIMGLPWYITLRRWKPSREAPNKETVKVEYTIAINVYILNCYVIIQYIIIDLTIVCRWKYIVCHFGTVRM